jgi:hypothetical protein
MRSEPERESARLERSSKGFCVLIGVPPKRHIHDPGYTTRHRMIPQNGKPVEVIGAR